MALIPLPNGAQVALATTLAAAKTVTAVSNANPAVATSAAHGYTDGDVGLFTSGWVNASNSVYRVDGATTGTFQLEGLDTSSTARFPASQGAGTFEEITAWTAVTLIPSFEKTGGEAKTTDISYLDVDKDRQAITGATAETLNFSVSYRPDSAMHAALLAASRSGEIQVLRLVMKDGSTIYYVGELFYNPAPTTTRDEEMVCMVTMTLQGEINRYAA
jgi:hypothetical protein